MNTMQTVSQVQVENGLKSERVEESLTLEPLHIQLKSGRVEEAEPGSGEPEVVKVTTVWDFTFSQPQPVAIELVEPKVVIYLNNSPTTEDAPAA
jgi:hypothetical protein